jgi:hypothetical protein
MEARAKTPPLFERHRSGHDHPWLAVIVDAIDQRLRAREGVGEYSTCPECILRFQIAESRNGLVLSDGTQVHAGDRIIDLHLWNEQLPTMPERGATLAWARRISRALDLSLRELARYLAERRDLDNVLAIRANLSLASGERSHQLARITARFGFERLAASRPQSGRLHRLGENILISLMVIAYNATAFRLDSLRRDRVPVYMSRRMLTSRFGKSREFAVPVHGSAPEAAPKSSCAALRMSTPSPPDARMLGR